MVDAPLPAYPCSMKHNKGFQDQYQLPDDDEEDADRIQARFQRLARKVRDESGIAQAKFVRLASQQDAPVFAQSNQGLFTMTSLPN